MPIPRVRSPFPTRSLWWITLLAWLSVAAGPPVWKSNHPQPIRLTWGEAQEVTTLAQGPPIRSRAGLLQDRSSGTILWAWRAEDPLPMASVTKLMTALLALESLDPEQTITVPAAAVKDLPADSARMGLQPGQQVQVRTLLYGALLPSGNDAALALAIAAAGSEQAFVAQMNARAQAWGMKATHFANPHGLDAPDHVASAQDLALLAQRALANPLIARIVATPSIDLEGFHLKNTNELLTRFPGAYGVKTGTTDAAGQVLIAAARRPGGDALTVVMHSQDRYAETIDLLNFYFQHWVWMDAGLTRDVLNRATGPDGTQYLLVTGPAPLFLPRWQQRQLRPVRRVQFDPHGRPRGVYQVWFGPQKLLETPITFQPLPPRPHATQ